MALLFTCDGGFCAFYFPMINHSDSISCTERMNIRLKCAYFTNYKPIRSISSLMFVDAIPFRLAHCRFLETDRAATRTCRQSGVALRLPQCRHITAFFDILGESDNVESPLGIGMLHPTLLLYIQNIDQTHLIFGAITLEDEIPLPQKLDRYSFRV